ncbi:lipoate-protein ligase A [Parelusimicrobium proximum]|uniref:hypothetical protein n=1 Tax=Parelusimicrobium proximum TaxID=3228953 RepID=UPI003D16B303
MRPVESDILSEKGEKVLGGALRKFERSMLYQGSFQTPGARSDEAVKEGIKKALGEVFGVMWESMAPAGLFIEKIKKDALEKYTSTSWINKF